MTSAAATPAYRRLSVEERRVQLLAAALTLFAHRAPDEVSLDDVAEAAGVSRPLVYRYFPGGKQQLYEAALRSSADALERCFAEPDLTGKSIRDVIGRARADVPGPVKAFMDHGV
ncbi:TetR family transcriptional regulator, partial [Streptomyces sp. NPDC050848]|uniref:helix-turn-helix domain-containing protein n=1 Tax=Streptomyces sp. NPDC050848 TaxID=3155791 RepID=UPI0033F59902